MMQQRYTGVWLHIEPAGLHAYRNTRVGHDGTVRLLLDKLADVAHKDEHGWTALILASKKGHNGTELLSSSGMPRVVGSRAGFLKRETLSCIRIQEHRCAVNRQD